VEAIPIGTDTRVEDAHAQATGFDPRTLAEEYVYLRITPRSIQAWREANELEDRQLMRKGEWLDYRGRFLPRSTRGLTAAVPAERPRPQAHP
jgi:hypothetical protein